jgi:uncharacterized phiE125 gp8 family phage protein
MLTALTPFSGDDIIPLADARVQLNLTADDTFHDAKVRDARDAAIGWAEGYTGRSLQQREWLWEIDQFCRVLTAPVGPVDSATVEYYDSDGVDTTIDPAEFYVGNNRLVAAINSSWPYADGRPGGVRITLTAGYATAEEIPTYLMAAVKLAMTAMFEDRSNPDLSAAERAADQFRPIL